MTVPSKEIQEALEWFESRADNSGWHYIDKGAVLAAAYRSLQEELSSVKRDAKIMFNVLKEINRLYKAAVYNADGIPTEDVKKAFESMKDAPQKLGKK